MPNSPLNHIRIIFVKQCAACWVLYIPPLIAYNFNSEEIPSNHTCMHSCTVSCESWRAVCFVNYVLVSVACTTFLKTRNWNWNCSETHKWLETCNLIGKLFSLPAIFSVLLASSLVLFPKVSEVQFYITAIACDPKAAFTFATTLAFFKLYLSSSSSSSGLNTHPRRLLSSSLRPWVGEQLLLPPPTWPHRLVNPQTGEWQQRKMWDSAQTF